MRILLQTERAGQNSWFKILINLLPFWLLSIAITREGFPTPPISTEAAGVAFSFAIVIGIVLTWSRWLTLDLILYSLFPFVLLFIFDEISTAYKTPFILSCAIILSAGMVGAQRSNSEVIRWRIWLVVNIIIWMLASHALQAYWNMVAELSFGDCFPYSLGCPVVAGSESPWWILFLTP